MQQRLRWSSLVALGLLALGITAHAQRPTFEVTSVKKRVGGAGPSSVTLPAVPPISALFSRRAATVVGLIRTAFDLQDYQVLGGPEWIRTEQFEVSATSATPPTAEQLRVMLQGLLETRFQLKTHREQRQMPTYALGLARSDGRLGPGIRRSAQEDCRAPNTVQPQRNIPAGAVRMQGCGQMADVARAAMARMRTHVTDETGLTGAWDYWLFFGGDPPGLVPSPERTAVDPSLPSFETALQEQLGLQLRATRGAVDVLVIDSVQLPSEN